MLDKIHPMIRPLDVEALRAQFDVGEPFRFVAIDDFLDPVFAERVCEAYPSLEEAGALGETFSAVNERGKTQITDSQRFAAPITELNDVLASSAWLEALERVTGIPKLQADAQLDGGGMHVMRSQAHLDVHIDFNLLLERKLHRRLNILVFFNPGWQEDWGGRTELWDQKVKHRHHAMLPIFNRCIIFETSEISFHGVQQVQCPKDRARLSFAAYYYTQDAPTGWDGTRHSTRFRARPEERAKRWMYMPASKLGRLGRRAIDGLLGRRR